MDLSCAMYGLPSCQVPISLVYRKGLAKLDGSDPLLLNG
jgi:protease II